VERLAGFDLPGPALIQSVGGDALQTLRRIRLSVKRYILTGAPGAGKTSILRRLGEVQFHDRSPFRTPALALVWYLGHPTTNTLTQEIARVTREQVFERFEVDFDKRVPVTTWLFVSTRGRSVPLWLCVIDGRRYWDRTTDLFGVNADWSALAGSVAACR
jgi:hypothetical protein